MTKKFPLLSTYVSDGKEVSYMRKYAFGPDYSRYNYSIIDYYRVLAIKYINVPLYQNHGGKKNKNAHVGPELSFTLSHTILMPFLLGGAIGWKSYRIAKTKNLPELRTELSNLLSDRI